MARLPMDRRGSDPRDFGRSGVEEVARDSRGR
jgi:hypothetical protein